MNKIQPIVPVDPKGLEEIAGGLLGESGHTKASMTLSKGNVNYGNYVLLPSKTHGNYQYGNTLVSMTKDCNNRSWYEARERLKGDGAHMLTPRQFIDFLALLRSGNAVDGNGNKIPASIVNDIYRDITELRNPRRGEWLDASFTKKRIGRRLVIFPKNELQIRYHAFDTQGIESLVVEPLDPYCRGFVNIDFDQLIAKATKQGLPEQSILEGKMRYWPPLNESVARFMVGPRKAVFSFMEIPHSYNKNIGVRPARLK